MSLVIVLEWVRQERSIVGVAYPTKLGCGCGQC